MQERSTRLRNVHTTHIKIYDDSLVWGLLRLAPNISYTRAKAADLQLEVSYLVLYQVVYLSELPGTSEGSHQQLTQKKCTLPKSNFSKPSIIMAGFVELKVGDKQAWCLFKNVARGRYRVHFEDESWI